jgi:hypothetical protein
MKAISSIHDRIKLALSKETGKYYTPEELDQEINSESQNLFNKYYESYAATQTEASYLAPFIVIEPLAFDGNVQGFVKPTDMVHPILVTTTDEKDISVIEHQYWTKRVNDPLVGPDDDNPIIRFDATAMRVLPITIIDIVLHYLKIPETAKWAYTKTGSQFIYDDNNSRDTGWTEVVNDQIINRVLTNLGLAQREPEVIQYGLTNQQIEQQ